MDPPTPPILMAGSSGDSDVTATVLRESSRPAPIEHAITLSRLSTNNNKP